MKTIPIFPTEIGVSYFNKDPNVYRDVWHKESTNIKSNLFNQVSINKNVLDLVELIALKKWILEQVFSYYKYLFNIEKDIKPYLTNSWLTFTNHNEGHFQHLHSNSIVSGVFYISVDEQNDTICFVNPKKVDTLCLGVGAEYNTWNQSVRPNMLLLFPSSIEHYVPRVKYENYTRISLSFNTFIKGTIGHVDSINELSL
tara:strand:+ start:1662 stop:2258 length:597 start_codon:yes stop_codon:yes gene_type:complete